MGEILIYFGIACIAYWVGWTLRGVMLIFKLSRDPKATLALLEELKELNESEARPTTTKSQNMVEVEAEHVGSMVYAYSKDTNQFLGQGSTIDEALKMASSRFPSKIFWLNETKKDSQTA